jgi:hypothetical protein
MVTIVVTAAMGMTAVDEEVDKKVVMPMPVVVSLVLTATWKAPPTVDSAPLPPLPQKKGKVVPLQEVAVVVGVDFSRGISILLLRAILTLPLSLAMSLALRQVPPQAPRRTFSPHYWVEMAEEVVVLL